VASKYVIRGELGRGGFAVVYDAEHTGLGRRVAVKVLHVDHEIPSTLLERARREARNAARVRHPNILEVFDAGALDDGSPFLVMERLEGETLARRIARQPLSIAAAVEVGRQLMLALEALAAESLVHRDIKPENVMLHDGGDGRLIVKVVDFGIAKRTVPGAEVRLTRDGTLVGTPSYMSPEQLRGEELDGRTDIYSAGAVLYEALTGHPPHEGESIEQVMVATLRHPVRAIRPERPDCPRQLERIVLRALSRPRDDRFRSAAAMRQALERVAEEHGLPKASKAWRAARPVIVAAVPGLRRGLTGALGRAAGSLARIPRSARAFAGGAAVALLVMGAVVVAQRAPERAAATPLAARSSTPAEHLAAPDVRPLQATLEPGARAAVPVLVPVTKAAADARRGVSPGEAESERSRASRRAQPAAVDGADTATRTEPRRAADELVDQALAAHALGDYAAAEASYRQVLAAYPRELRALRGLGLVAARRGKHDEARAALERYLELAPDGAEAAAVRERIAAMPR
jgi:Flp pilus assembly protein TadD